MKIQKNLRIYFFFKNKNIFFNLKHFLDKKKNYNIIIKKLNDFN